MRRTPLGGMIVLALAASAGCGSRGRGAGSAEAGGEKGGAQAVELLENLDESAIGPSGKFGTIGYRGGPNESMVIADCNQCSGSWSDELLKENDGYGYRPDDPPVEQKVAPAPDVGEVPLAAPTWCGRYDGILKRARATLRYDPLTRALDPQFMVEHLKLISQMACDRVRYAPRQRQVVNLLQAWLNLAHIKFASIVPVLEVLAAPVKEHGFLKVGNSGDPVVDALVNGCGPLDPSHRPPDNLYAALDSLDILEGAGKLTELDRAGLTCQAFAGPFAVVDIRKLDMNKAQDELALRLASKALSQEAYDDALLGLVDYRLWQPRMLDASSSDPSVKRLHSATTKKAEDTYASWHKTVLEPNKEVLQTAFGAMARARGPMASAKGCSAETRPLFEKMVKAKSTKRADLDSLLSDPVGSVVFQADALCNAIDDPLLGAAQVDAIRREMSWLGPRRAAYVAALMPEDGSKAMTSVASSRLRDLFAFKPVNKGYPENVGTWVYEIKSAVVKGEDLVVTAVAAKWTDPTFNCVSTDKIKRIRPDGYLEYEEECFQTGTEALKMEYAPMLLPKELAGLVVKGGIVAMMLEDAPDKHAFVSSQASAALKADPVRAYPMIVYPNSKPDAPVSFYFGVKLK